MIGDIAPELFHEDELLLVPEALLLPEGPVRGHAVRVSDGRFTAVGPAADLIEENRDLTPVRLPNKLLMPGFVDAHTHLTQAFGKALVFGEPSEIWRRVWVPLEMSLDYDLAYISAKLAALEALRGGFTTVCDAGTRGESNVEAAASAVRDAGVRCVLGFICNNRDANGHDIEREVLREASGYLSRYEADALIHPSLACSVPEAASNKILYAVSEMCADAGTVFQIHVNEHLAAVERSLERCGVRPLEQLHKLGALGPQVLAAHATLITADEFCMLRDTDTAVSYNPVASQWKGNAVAPAMMMAAQDVRFGIGTDATRGDGFRLIDAAEAAQRLTFGIPVGDFSCGAGATWFDHGTAAGAQAAGLGEVTGEIAPGKAADYLIVDLDVPEMQPSWDLTWELVRLANRDQIIGVVVGGVLRLWRGWPIDWDGKALIEEVREVAHKAIERAGIEHTYSEPVRTLMSILVLLSLAVSALVVGILIGGVGIGGVLLPPALLYVGGFNLHLAMATSMWSFLFTGIAGTVIYSARQTLNWNVVFWLSVGVVPSALLGARINLVLPAGVLTVLLATLVIATGINALLKSAPATEKTSRLLSRPSLISVGAVVGFGSALTGTGGPVLLVPILLSLRMSPLLAIGASQVIQIPVAVVATAGYVQYGQVDFAFGTVLGLIAAIGVVIGAKISHKLPVLTLQRIVAVSLIGAGLIMVAHNLIGNG